MKRLLLLAALASPACLKTALPELGNVPAFALTAETGQPFRETDLKGKVWIANFIFTTCTGPCPRMSSQMRQLQNQLGSSPDIRLISLTINPVDDTPEVLAAYGRQFGADPARWSFLTGEPEELKKLSNDAFHLGGIGGALQHSTRFVLVDKKARVRGYYDSSDPQALKDIVIHARALRREMF